MPSYSWASLISLPEASTYLIVYFVVDDAETVVIFSTGALSEALPESNALPPLFVHWKIIYFCSASDIAFTASVTSVVIVLIPLKLSLLILVFLPLKL